MAKKILLVSRRRQVEPLLKVVPENRSISRFFAPNALPTLKRDQYRVQGGYSITGEAPKQFLRVYEAPPRPRRRLTRTVGPVVADARPCCGRKANRRTWALYIAKTARKWYPTESIMEYALNRIGEVWGLRMAASRLVWAGGQVRFLSRYFLTRNCLELVHGADILADYLNDKAFVQAIEDENRERELNSVQLFGEALRAVFPTEHQALLADFGRLLLFDALVGNNDRHFYNYGVVRDVTAKRPAFFSPIYDTARALLWNEKEAKLVALHRDPQRAATFLARYTKGAQPKLGWEGERNINHFDLVRLMATSSHCLPVTEIWQFYEPARLDRVLQMLDDEFAALLSPERLDLMKRCLQLRFTHLTQLLCSIPQS